MLVSYSIHGKIVAEDKPIRCKYRIKNLTTKYESEVYKSEVGYFNINLANLPTGTFNKDDLLIIEFWTIIVDVEYYNRSYTVIDPNKITTVMDIVLIDDWEYTSDLIHKLDNRDLKVTFITSYYKHILYRLYYQFNGVYTEVDRKLTTEQEFTITFEHGGRFMLIGYVTDEDRLLTYDQVVFTVDAPKLTGYDYSSVRYLEWE